MPEEKSPSITLTMLMTWLPLFAMIGGWVYILGTKDQAANFVQVQVNEQREEHKEMWKQIRENLGAIIDQKAKIEFMQRELDQERQIREARK